ncbi:MAG: hypothetical protein KJZ62_03060 [Fimbriimonadaceae bacterium]|nr:hypothetical protein [Fimbriimonadaceae bacterium]QOJ12877.1 MAG: AtpZ/AtpI family protein [Chthonomonadaceae bacterium]
MADDENGSPQEDTDPLAEVEKKLKAELEELQRIDERIAESRKKSALPEVPEWEYQRKRAPKKTENIEYLGLGVGLSVAYTLVGCIGVGWGIGKLIDLNTGSTLGQAIGTMIGAIVGLGGALFTLIRAQNKPR